MKSEFEMTGFGLAHPREASGAKETSWNRGKEVWAGLRRWFLVRVRFESRLIWIMGLDEI